MKNHDSKGRFVSGNTVSRLGGYARAQKLSPERLSEIGRKGWQAFVDKYFHGNEQAAKDYASALYMWASDAPYYGTTIQKFFRPNLPEPDPNYSKDNAHA